MWFFYSERCEGYDASVDPNCHLNNAIGIIVICPWRSLEVGRRSMVGCLCVCSSASQNLTLTYPWTDLKLTYAQQTHRRKHSLRCSPTSGMCFGGWLWTCLSMKEQQKDLHPIGWPSKRRPSRAWEEDDSRVGSSTDMACMSCSCCQPWRCCRVTDDVQPSED